MVLLDTNFVLYYFKSYFHMYVGASVGYTKCFIFYFLLKIMYMGAKEITQWLRPLPLFQKNSGSIPNTHTAT